MDTGTYTASMTDAQRAYFISEYNEQKKEGSTGALLAFFLGGLGAHHFYMGNIIVGVIYLLFCWTFIPAILGVIELFLMGGRAERHNRALAEKISAKIRMMSEAGARAVAVV